MKKFSRKFNDWAEADKWGAETSRYLEPIGYRGEESIVRQYNHGKYSVEMWKRLAEVLASGERNDVLVGVTDYVVVLRVVGEHDNLIHTSDKDDADEVFDHEVQSIINNIKTA